MFVPTDPKRWYKQTILEEGKGNCMETAVACLLGLPIEQLPNFREEGEDAASVWFAFEEFFLSHGYEVLRREGNWCPDGLHLASGLTHRGTRHMVVMQGGVLLHDPHPDGTGLVTQEYTYILMPTDPICMVFREYPVRT